MKIKKVALKNWMGVEDLSIQPGALTVIAGRNGSGKTSIIEALKSTVGSGHDPSVVRKGADAAIVSIELSDGTRIRMRVTEKSTTREITDAQGRKITRSAEYIKSICNGLSVDPMAFLFAKPADQLRAFLEAAPISIDSAALGFLPVSALDGVSLDAHGLEVIEKIDKAIRAERTEINRVAKDKEGTIRQLTETLPPESPEGTNWREALDRTTKELRELQADTMKRRADIQKDAADATLATRELFRTKKEAVEAELNEAIERLRADAAIEIGRCEKDRDERLTDITHHERRAYEAMRAEYDPKHAELTQAHAQARAMVEAEAKAEKTMEFIETQMMQAEAAREQAEALTSAIEQLASFKAGLLSELPVPGMTVQDGELFLDGIPFHRINKAKQIAVAIELAKLRSGELGFVLVDDLEHLDQESFAAFKAGAAESGLQFVAAMVSDDPLNVGVA